MLVFILIILIYVLFYYILLLLLLYTLSLFTYSLYIIITWTIHIQTHNVFFNDRKPAIIGRESRPEGASHHWSSSHVPQAFVITTECHHYNQARSTCRGVQSTLPHTLLTFLTVCYYPWKAEKTSARIYSAKIAIEVS